MRDIALEQVIYAMNVSKTNDVTLGLSLSQFCETVLPLPRVSRDNISNKDSFKK